MNENSSHPSGLVQILTKPVDRRTAIQTIGAGLALGLGFLEASCSPIASAAEREKAELNWQEYFQGNFKVMTDEEKKRTVERLERMHHLQTGESIQVSATEASKDVLFGYAFNISKCRGYMDCVRACQKENNTKRKILKDIRLNK